MTRLEHLQTLPEPYRMQAIENCKEDDRLMGVDSLSKETDETTAEVLYGSFPFEDTPQWFDYWIEFYNTL